MSPRESFTWGKEHAYHGHYLLKKDKSWMVNGKIMIFLYSFIINFFIFMHMFRFEANLLSILKFYSLTGLLMVFLGQTISSNQVTITQHT